jgi:predicted  nucleic acid-binding Zn-ribbon protein
MSSFDEPEDAALLTVYERVRCLDCGTVYAKPSRGGTARSNPGCPECGYVGWVSVDLPLRGASELPRSAEDPPLRRSAQSR